MVEPVSTTIVVVKGICWICTVLGFGYCAKKGHDAYKQGQKTKREKYELKGKSLEAAREDNKRLDNRDKEIDKELGEGEKNEKQLEKEVNDIKKELDDLHISKEREAELKGKLAFIQTQLDDIKKKNKRLTRQKHHWKD